MKTLYVLLTLFMVPYALHAQVITRKLDDVFAKMENDTDLKHAIVSLYVLDGKTGKEVYNKNGDVGLAAASSQKVITSTTSFELLGHDYRFKTELAYNGKIENGVLNGDLFIVGYGDPTLGSWRYGSNKTKDVMDKWMSEIKKLNIQKITGSIYLDASAFSHQPIPGGWIWDDIGNYYGAGIWGLNWHENQYDLYLKPGSKEGDDVEILRTEPALQGVALFNLLKTGKKGSGDQSRIFLPPYSGAGVVNGTVPAGEKEFVVSGSFPNPLLQLQDELKNVLKENNIVAENGFINSNALIAVNRPMPKPSTVFYTHYSPPLDSINYWFLKKSINLYGECLLKTLAYEKQGRGNIDDGLKVIKNFWKDEGIDITSINIQDGSGLSPENRVTTKSLATVMQYAKGRSWFASFYNSLPLYNNLSMKSGTISGAKSFTGYVTARDGYQYTFAIIVNNYNGPASAMVNKMYKVLDVLK